MKHITLLLLAWLTLCAPLHAAFGDWVTHNASPSLNAIQYFGGQLYIQTGNSLCSLEAEGLYDAPLRQYTKQDGLTGSEVQFLLTCPTLQRLVIVYANGNVDLMAADGTIQNIPDLAATSVSGDKTLYAAHEDQGRLYLATGIGLVVMDLKQRYIADTYGTSYAIRFGFSHDGYVYRYSDTRRLEACSLTANTSATGNWQQVSTLKFRSAHLVTIGGQRQVWLIDSDGELLRLEGPDVITPVITGTFTDVIDTLDRWVVLASGMDNKVFIDRETGERTTTTDQPLASFSHLCTDGSGHYYGLLYESRIYTLDDVNYAPGQYITFEIQYEGYRTPEGLSTYYPGELQLTASGLAAISRIGYVNSYSAAHSLTGQLCLYDKSEQLWRSIDRQKGILDRLRPGVGFQGLTGLAVDPLHEERYAISSGMTGIYIIDHDTLFCHLDEVSMPGDVEAFNAGYASTRISAVAYDADGRLYFTNSQQEVVLRCITPEGKCIKFPNPGMNGVSEARRILISRHDAYGFKWVLNDYGYQKSRVGIYYDHGTPENLSDDDRAYFTTLMDQDGNYYVPSYIYDLCEDLSGTVWVLTDVGPFAIENPEATFDYAKKNPGRGKVRRIKIPRNDGTNLADYLMVSTQCRCMAIDNFNRKWIGTAGDGLYLMSSDALTEIHHFTSGNSPLPSDNINSLCYDDHTGILYVATEGGVLSYQTDAIEGEDDMDGIYCYPNPVQPEYSGSVHIMGLMNDSQVSITDALGNLVMRTHSQGAVAEWDVRGNDGSRVAPGVYLIHGIDKDGKKGKICKLLVL